MAADFPDHSINNYMPNDSKMISEAYGSMIREQVDNTFLKWVEMYFEDLFNITDQRELLEKIRGRIEIPEIKDQIGPAQAGSMVEMVYDAIKTEQVRRSEMTADENSEESPAHTSRMTSIADEIEMIARRLSRGQIDEDGIQQLFGIAEEIRREYR
jgi:predicted transcriptional regulator